MKKPAELYAPSPRKYEGLPDVSYPIHDKTVNVANCGSICLDGKKVRFSMVFDGHDAWLVRFML